MGDTNTPSTMLDHQFPVQQSSGAINLLVCVSALAWAAPVESSRPVSDLDCRDSSLEEKFFSFSGREAASTADCSWDFFRCSLSPLCCGERFRRCLELPSHHCTGDGPCTGQENINSNSLLSPASSNSLSPHSSSTLNPSTHRTDVDTDSTISVKILQTDISNLVDLKIPNMNIDFDFKDIVDIKITTTNFRTNTKKKT